MGKRLLLGTAGWGMRTSKSEAFKIIEEFQAIEATEIDTATNYPISSKIKDFGLAISWLSEWTRLNNQTNTRIFIKIGSIDNSGKDISDLSPESIRETISRLQDSLGSNLLGIGIHWDNRNSFQDILETLLSIQEFESFGYQFGLSGVESIDLYRETDQIDSTWSIQVKEYPGNDISREKYSKYFPNNPYIAYGLSHLLRNLPTADYEARRQMYFHGMGWLFKNENLDGYIVSPSTHVQGKEIISHHNYLRSLLA